MTPGTPHRRYTKQKRTMHTKAVAVQLNSIPFRSINIVAKNVNCLFALPFTHWLKRLTSQSPKTDVIHLHFLLSLWFTQADISSPVLDD